MYVFLGLLQQMGFDGCLLGPPDAKSVLWFTMPNSTDSHVMLGGPRGPFWAVGVRIGHFTAIEPAAPPRIPPHARPVPASVESDD